MINIDTLTFNNLQVNTYIVSDETKDAVIVDAACNSTAECNTLFEHIKSKGLRIVKLINTHGHVDHIAGVAKVVSEYKVPFLMHAKDAFLLETAPEMGALFGFEIDTVIHPDTLIDEPDSIKFGNSELKTLHVPGHSPGSIVFYSTENKIAIVGDVLFNGSIGRSDLPGGDHDTLISGIKNKLLKLPEDTVVYSGHGPTTTIKQEHDTNPFLV